MSPRFAIGVLAAVSALAIDQLTKLWLLHIFQIARRGMTTVTPFLDIVLAWNTGISYGWFQNESAWGQAALLGFKAIAIVALLIWMARAHDRLATAALGLIVGGAIGNAIDRWSYGAVVDFVLLHAQIAGKTYYWYVFNLADVAIVAGVGLLLYDSIFRAPAVKAP